MPSFTKISPCLWFDDQAEPAAEYYCGIFKDSKIVRVSRYTAEGREIHRKPPGSVLTVEFELERQPFTALNGGPEFKFNEAVSLMVLCKTQEEIDTYWDKLRAGGDEKAQVCGWLKDKYGVSWQVVPAILAELMGDKDAAKSGRVMAALMKMKKLDIETLKQAYDGR
jgi:predicted 3-demethylubiquinone-9 3-methyltransferase (glyoxalase superfamily)